MRSDILERLSGASPLLAEAAAEIRDLRRRLSLAEAGISPRGEFVAGARLALSITPEGSEEHLEELLELAEVEAAC